jgi:Uma2 family endonuclease
MSTVQVPAGQRLVLSGIDWRTYGRLLRAFDERPGVRLTYDRGVLEIMTLSPEHERFKHLLRRLIEALAEEMGLTIAGFGSMTFRRRRRRRGLEADECFWIANEPRVRGKDRIDLRVDPPPDLVVEVDVSRSSLDRLAIYASLGVPEVALRRAGADVPCPGDERALLAGHAQSIVSAGNPRGRGRFPGAAGPAG